MATVIIVLVVGVWLALVAPMVVLPLLAEPGGAVPGPCGTAPHPRSRPGMRRGRCAAWGGAAGQAGR